MASIPKLLTRLFARSSPAPERTRIIVKRGYEGAQTDRFNTSWQVSNQPADIEIRSALEPLRNRARDLAVNNEYARKFLQMCVTNIVGPQGFSLQALARDYDKPDTLARDIIETGFWRWAARGTCELSGLHSFQDVQRLLVEAWKRDGEFLVRKIRGPKAGNEFNFALQILEIDRLATQHNLPDTGRGTRIVMGVELALDTGKPVAYWLRLGVLTSASGAGKVTSVPADEIIHAFRPERTEQHRGVPPMHPVMGAIKMLAGYQESYIVACRTGASKMGFFVSPDGNASSLATGKDESTGEFYTDAAPGEFGVLPDGYQFQQFNPDYPGQNYDVFVKECLRSIASGLGVCYNGLANNLEGVNFSSIRAGVLEERDNWMVDQDWFVEAFMRPVFNEWLIMSLTAQALRFQSGSALPIAKLAKFSEHVWQGRRWAWVDPRKDIEASILAINAKLNSPQNIVAQMGLDLGDVLQQIAAANALAQQAGLGDYTNITPPQATTKTPPEPEE